MTGFYIYFCWFFPYEKKPCYANHYTRTPVEEGAGQDVADRYYDNLLLGSVCGIVELLRNSLHLWAKCCHRPKLALIFSVLGFVTAFLFMLNFVLMMLWRNCWEGKVCAGDFLNEAERKT